MTSAGIRSGVNWMRAKLPSNARASARTSSVLPRPGHALDQHVAAGGGPTRRGGRGADSAHAPTCRLDEVVPFSLASSLSYRFLFPARLWMRCAACMIRMKSAPRIAPPAARKRCASSMEMPASAASARRARLAARQRSRAARASAPQRGVARCAHEALAQSLRPVEAAARAQVVEQAPARRCGVGLHRAEARRDAPDPQRSQMRPPASSTGSACSLAETPTARGARGAGTCSSAGSARSRRCQRSSCGIVLVSDLPGCARSAGRRAAHHAVAAREAHRLSGAAAEPAAFKRHAAEVLP